MTSNVSTNPTWVDSKGVKVDEGHGVVSRNGSCVGVGVSDCLIAKDGSGSAE